MTGKRTEAAVGPYGARTPGPFNRAVIAATGRLPDNWLGLRLAILLRRLVMMRLGDDGGFDVERWGLRLRLHPRHNGCEKGLLFTPQMYEVPERAALAARIGKGLAAKWPFVFVDIGANVGLFSLFVASRAGREAKILAIEPENENVRRLSFNLAANPGLPVRVLALALGETAGRLAIDLNAEDRGGTRTRPLGPAEAGVVAVECKPLADVLAQENVTRIDALKIDVEGAEDRILMPFFKTAPPNLWPRFILIEDSRGEWRIDLFAELAARGYKTASRTRQNVMLEL